MIVLVDSLVATCKLKIVAFRFFYPAGPWVFRVCLRKARGSKSLCEKLSIKIYNTA